MEPENQSFEEKRGPLEQELDALLTNALHVIPPEGLSDRVVEASIASINNARYQVVEHQLEEAFAIPDLKGLTSGVFQASVSSLPVPELQSPQVVIAKFDARILWRQVALAACLVFAALIAVQVDRHTTVSMDTTMVAEALSPEEEALLLEDLNLGEYAYLSDTHELAFADITKGLVNLRDDLELWQFGLLTE